jgi:hypothetical protein
MAVFFWDVPLCTMSQRPDDGGSKHLRNVGQYLPHAATSQKTSIFILVMRSGNVTSLRKDPEIGYSYKKNCASFKTTTDETNAFRKTAIEYRPHTGRKSAKFP